MAGAEVEAALDRETHIRLAASVLKVEVHNQGGGYSLGSAVLIDTGEVVTNCHVTRRAARIYVLQGGLRLAVAGQAANMARDLCVLRVAGLYGTPVALAPAGQLKPGDPVVAVGYTGGLAPWASRGELVSRHRLSDAEVLRTSTRFNSGASGGALFNAQGQLLGVLTFRLRGAEGHYFSVPAQWLAPRQHDLADFRPVAPLAGRAFWEAEPEAQPSFLHAASLAAQQQWQPLAQLARQWAGREPQEAEPLEHLATALEGSGDLAGAERAQADSTALQPDEPRAWWRLAQLRQRLGRLADARAALARLRQLATPLAQRLADDLSPQLERP